MGKDKVFNINQTLLDSISKIGIKSEVQFFDKIKLVSIKYKFMAPQDKLTRCKLDWPSLGVDLYGDKLRYTSGLLICRDPCSKTLCSNINCV